MFIKERVNILHKRKDTNRQTYKLFYIYIYISHTQKRDRENSC